MPQLQRHIYQGPGTEYMLKSHSDIQKAAVTIYANTPGKKKTKKKTQILLSFTKVLLVDGGGHSNRFGIII